MDDHARRASPTSAGPAIVTGPRSPQFGTPRRMVGSVRRTTSVDGAWGTEGLVLEATGRDLLTGDDGRPAAVVEQCVKAVAGPDMTVATLTATPPVAGLEALVGLPLRGSMRRTLWAMPGFDDEQNLARMLIDDMVASALISGYARQRTLGPGGPGAALVEHMADICAGWGADAQMARVTRSSGQVPLVIGPAAPSLDERGDPLAWHALGSLATGTVRRRRRTDVVPAGQGPTARIDAMFRDGHQEVDGTLSVLHEYSLAAVVDTVSGRLLSIEADPRVLPAAECPSAAASAHRLVGEALADLRHRMRQDFRGTGTCTHLNDLLRSLADVPALWAWAGAQRGANDRVAGP